MSPSLLVHSVILRKAAEVDREQVATFKEYTLGMVRLEVATARAQNTAGAVVADEGVLYVDSRHSWSVENDAEDADAALVLPCEGDEVVFGGRVWRVAGVAGYGKQTGYTDHWEVKLV